MTTGFWICRSRENYGNAAFSNGCERMVHIAHEEGFAVMSHTNGCYGVQAAVEAGVDSIEHGNYMDDETISMLADSESVWVPNTCNCAES